MHLLFFIEPVQITMEEEEEDEGELEVSKYQPFGLHSSAVCGGGSEQSRSAGPRAAVPTARLEPIWYEL